MTTTDTAPARMTAAARHPFEVVTTPRHPHPMIVGTIARVAKGIRGGAGIMQGQPVVISDARRCRPDGPLWLTLNGFAVSGPLAGRHVSAHMTVDFAQAGGLTDYVPGEWRASECTHIDHDAPWHLTYNPLVGTGRTWDAQSADAAAQLAHVLVALRPTFAAGRGVDTTSSASVQHFIDTGRYLPE